MHMRTWSTWRTSRHPSRQSVAAQPRRLLETIAVHAARGVLARYAAVQEVRLRVVKPEPAGLDAAEESVELRLSR